MPDFATFLLGALFFFPILYYLVRGAVEEGTLRALIKYESLKSLGHNRTK